MLNWTHIYFLSAGDFDIVHWSCDSRRQLVKDYYVVHSSPNITVMTRVGGNPESTLRFQTHVMSNLVHDELNDADGF